PFPENRVYLSELGNVIKDFFGFQQQPIVISNACISGGLALAVAKRFIAAGKFDQAIVVGGDLVSEFVVSGFNSFQAMSPEPCRPFSKNRKGISLGEAAVAVLVSSKKPQNSINISLIGEASANDANHISGPSRTGEGLYKSIQNALREAQVSAKEIDYLSAHGTATAYNDEMEAVAFNRSGLEKVPMNSFKGYYGHTLGASALLESILTKHSLLNNELYTSLNFDEIGISKPLNVIGGFERKELKFALKTASGFGGCNLALVLKKEENE
ncbi:MAG: beta-ketoacyl synthase, partial [Flavobacteriaceae bacterium]|nr:beta-ketoacyl synthase [Flavobacteriaceae bacterium]